MANPLDDIQTLLNAMKDRGAEMSAFKDLLASIDTSLSDIVSLIESDKKDDSTEDSTPEPGDMAIAEAINRLIEQLKNEKEDPPPNIQVNVPAPQVTIKEKEDTGGKWKIDFERSGTGPSAPMKSMTVTRL
jgi:hypothetical protein